MTQHICSVAHWIRALVTLGTPTTTVLSRGAWLGMWLAASVAAAAPGDPFGGDDTGCVPQDRAGVLCGTVISKALAKLTANIRLCHMKQAKYASDSPENAEYLEDFCGTAAKERFDAVLSNNNCDAAVTTNAAARRDVLLADQSSPESLDALNGRIYCDSSSGMNIAEPGGDDAGYIPADTRSRHCSEVVARAHATLVKNVYKCHAKAARHGFSGSAFDEDACEDGAPPLKSALTKYNSTVQGYMSHQSCPPCLVFGAATLGTDTVSGLDAQNVEIFPCP